MINNETLISCVHKRQSMWDKKHPQYGKRRNQEKCWAEISKEMNVADVKRLQRKWKYLRDQFSVELGKFQEANKGHLADRTPTSTWEYFNKLMFVKDFVVPRRKTRHMSTSSSSSESNQIEEAEVEKSRRKHNNNRIEDKETVSLANDKTKFRGSKKRRRLLADTCKESRLHDGKQKNHNSQEKLAPSKKDGEENEDRLFFISLIPYVRKIPQFRKLLFRNKMLEVVQKYAYVQEPNPSNNIPCPVALHPARIATDAPIIPRQNISIQQTKDSPIESILMSCKPEPPSFTSAF